ncbi:MAG: RHS repeat domain-containing protein [Dehalococcoidia bacterium]
MGQFRGSIWAKLQYQNHVYHSDGNGNTISRGTDSFTWDPLNRLTSMSAGGVSASMTYNGDGMRLSRTTGGSTTNYLWDIGGGLPQIIDDGTQYVPDLGAAALGQITPAGMYYLLADELSSTVAVIDSSGTVQQTYSYDAFGKATAGTNNHPVEYQFDGQQMDPNGMQALRARFYDPSTGRFMSGDSFFGNRRIGQSITRYSYSMNNPMRYSNPSGRFPGVICNCGGAEPNPGGAIGVATALPNDGTGAAVAALTPAFTPTPTPTPTPDPMDTP